MPLHIQQSFSTLIDSTGTGNSEQEAIAILLNEAPILERLNNIPLIRQMNTDQANKVELSKAIRALQLMLDGAMPLSFHFAEIESSVSHTLTRFVESNASEAVSLRYCDEFLTAPYFAENSVLRHAGMLYLLLQGLGKTDFIRQQFKQYLRSDSSGQFYIQCHSRLMRLLIAPGEFAWSLKPVTVDVAVKPVDDSIFTNFNYQEVLLIVALIWQSMTPEAERAGTLSETLLGNQQRLNSTTSAEEQRLFTITDALLQCAGWINVAQLIQCESSAHHLLEGMSRLQHFMQNISELPTQKTRILFVFGLQLRTLMAAAPLSIKSRELTERGRKVTKPYLHNIPFAIQEVHHLLALWLQALTSDEAMPAYYKVMQYFSRNISTFIDPVKITDRIASANTVINYCKQGIQQSALGHQQFQHWLDQDQQQHEIQQLRAGATNATQELPLLSELRDASLEWQSFLEDAAPAYSDIPLPVTVLNLNIAERGEFALLTSVARLATLLRCYPLPTVLQTSDNEQTARTARGVLGIMATLKTMHHNYPQQANALIRLLCSPGISQQLIADPELNQANVTFTFLPKWLLLATRFNEHQGLLEPQTTQEFASRLLPGLVALAEAASVVTDFLEQRDFSGTLAIELQDACLVLNASWQNGATCEQAIAANPVVRHYLQRSVNQRLHFMRSLLKALIYGKAREMSEFLQALEKGISPIRVSISIERQFESLSDKTKEISQAEALTRLLAVYQKSAPEAYSAKATLSPAELNALLRNTTPLQRWLNQADNQQVLPLLGLFNKANSFEKEEYTHTYQSICLLYIIAITHPLDVAHRTQFMLTMYGGLLNSQPRQVAAQALSDDEKTQVCHYFSALMSAYQRLNPFTQRHLATAIALHDLGKSVNFQQGYAAELPEDQRTIGNHQQVLDHALSRNEEFKPYQRCFTDRKLASFIDLLDVAGHNLEAIRSKLFMVIKDGQQCLNRYQSFASQGQGQQKERAETLAFAGYLSAFADRISETFPEHKSLARRYQFLKEPTLSWQGLNDQQRNLVAQLITMGLCRVLSQGPANTHKRFSATELVGQIVTYFQDPDNRNALQPWIVHLMGNLVGKMTLSNGQQKSTIFVFYNLTGLMWRDEGLFKEHGISVAELIETIVPHLISQAEAMQAQPKDMATNIFQLVQLVEYWFGLIETLNSNENNNHALVAHLDCCTETIRQSCLDALRPTSVALRF